MHSWSAPRAAKLISHPISIALRTTLAKARAVTSIAGTVLMVVLPMPRLRAAVFRRWSRAFAPGVAIRPGWRWAFAPRAITFTGLLGPLAATSFHAPVFLTISPVFAVGAAWAFALSTRLVRSRIVTLRTARFATVGTPRWGVTRRTKFLGCQLPVPAAVEFAQGVGCPPDFVGIDHPVMICVEGIEKSGRRTLMSGRVFRPWTAFAAGSAVALRGVLGALGWILLSAQRPRRKREGHRGGKYLSGVHRFAGCWV